MRASTETTHQPKAPLPWRLAGGLTSGYALISGHEAIAETDFTEPRNARYIVHAGNAYPRLVQALLSCELSAEATALLRELGELA